MGFLAFFLFCRPQMKIMFYTCLSFCSRGGGCIPTWNGQGCVFQHAMGGCQSGSRGVHPPGQTPPLTHTHTLDQTTPRETLSLPGQTSPAMVERDFTATSKVTRPNTKISIGQGMDSVSHLCVLLLLESKVNENKIISMMDYQVEFYKYWASVFASSYNLDIFSNLGT